MSSACPRCKKPHDGRADSRGWSTCKECYFCWQLDAAPPAAPAAAAKPAPAKFPSWGKSDEYAPDDSLAPNRARPLTTREQGGEPHPPAQPRQPARQKPHPSVTKSQLIEGLPSLHSSAIAEDVVDSQLFERLEAHAQASRAKQDTHPQIVPPSAMGSSVASTIAPPPPSPAGALSSVAEERIDCPVCGHGFPPVGSPPSTYQTCPQCSTTFNLEDGQLASSGEHPAGDDWLVGRTIRGCTIDKKIGEGGMGAVYHAKQLSLDRGVAIKVMPAELARNKNFIQRFEREAKSLARINHPNILHIYDFGEDQALGIYFMIIEFVDGRDLGELLRERHTLDQIQVLDVMRQAALGLEMASEKGVIHRDIKPDNLMISHDGICKVSDFGLAKGYGAFDDVTSTGVRVGTPAFMSPEQCDGLDVDYHADVYSLGCTCYLALTGLLPFTGDSPFSIMLKHKTDAPPSVREQNIDVDPRVDDLIRRMLAKVPAERCETLRQLILEIEALQIELSGTSSILRASGGDRPLHRDSSGAHPVARPRAPEAPVDLRIVDEASRPIPGALPPPPGTTPLQPQLPTAPMPAVIDLSPRGTPLQGDPRRSSSSNRLATAGDDGRRARSSGRLKAMGGGLPAAGEDSPTHRLVAKGDAAIIGNRADEAIEAYQQALKRKPGNRDVQAKLAEARRLHVELQINEIEAAADGLAAAGRVHEAVAEWLRASQLSANVRRREQLLGKVDGAQRGLSRRRGLRRSIGAGFFFFLLFAVAYFWTPLAHNWLAERRMGEIQALPESPEKSVQLRAFAADYSAPWPWYPRLFALLDRLGLRVTYVVPLGARALEEADEMDVRLKVEGEEQKEQAQSDAFAALEAKLADEKLPWAEVERIATAGAPTFTDPLRRARIEGIAVRARQAVAAATAARSTVDAAHAAGDHVQALSAAEGFRRSHPRSGALLQGLPLPARVAVVDADGSGLPEGLKMTVDGVAVQPGPVCRFAEREVVVELSAPGFLPERLLIAADPSTADKAYKVAMHAGRAWNTKLPGKNWQRLFASGGRIVAIGPDAIATVAIADGGSATVLARGDLNVTASDRGARWSWIDPAGALAGTTDGVVAALRWTDGVPAKADILRRGTRPVIGFVQKALAFQLAKVRSFLLEPTVQGADLAAYDGDDEVWRWNKAKGKLPAQLFVRDERVYVADDFELHVLDEGGDRMGSRTFESIRTAPVATLGDGSILLIIGDERIEVLRIGGSKIEAVPFPIGDRPLAVAVRGDELLIAGDRGKLHRLSWQNGGFVVRWSIVLPDGRLPKHDASIGDGLVGIGDQLGAFDILSDVDGAFIRRYQLDRVLPLPPVIAAGRVVMLENDTLTALHLPPASGR